MLLENNSTHGYTTKGKGEGHVLVNRHFCGIKNRAVLVIRLMTTNWIINMGVVIRPTWPVNEMSNKILQTALVCVLNSLSDQNCRIMNHTERAWASTEQISGVGKSFFWARQWTFCSKKCTSNQSKLVFVSSVEFLDRATAQYCPLVWTSM